MYLATVFCDDGYPPEFIEKWSRACKRHHPDIPQLVFTDTPIALKHPNWTVVDLTSFREKYSVCGWWCKFALFFADTELIFIDVDNVILSPLDRILCKIPTFGLSMAKDWTEGWGPYTSNVMRIQPLGELPTAIREEWRIAYRYVEKFEKGDQQLLNNMFEWVDMWPTLLPPRSVGSYKGCTEQMSPICHPGSFDESEVMCFHGQPKPDEVIIDKLPMWDVVEEHWK